MKRFLVIAPLALMLAGCITTQLPDGTTVKRVDPQAIATLATVALPPAVQFAVGADKNAAPYFRAVQVAIDAVLAGGAFDPATVSATIDKMTVNELKTPEAKAAVEAALGIYRSFAGQAVTAKLDSSGYVIVLRAARQAIEDGLSRPPIVVK